MKAVLLSCLQVNLLDRYRCDVCSAKVEMMLEEEETTCHCGSTVTKNEHAVINRSPADEDS